MNVLVVDDNSTNRKLLRVMLESEGHSVVEAANGLEGLDVLRRDKVDSIISDILMPQLDGYRFCHEVRRDERFRQVPFIIYSSTYTSPSDETFALEVGADRFVRKPAAAKDLVALLQELKPHPHPVTRAPIEELAVVREYSERLVAKLEEKNAALFRTSEELREARDFYLTLLDDFPTPIWRSGVDAQCNYFNHTWLAFTGRKLEEELGDGWMQNVHAEDVARVVQEYLAAFDARRPFQLEYRLRRFDGVYRTVVDHGQPYQGLDGNFAGYIGSCYDITESRRAEHALQDSQARLASIITSAMDAIITVDAGQRIVLFNAAAERMFRCPAPDAMGHKLDRFIPSRFRNAHRHHIRGFGETGVTSRAMGALGVVFGLRADGEEFPIEASISQVEVAGEKLFTVVLRDITERRNAETNLRESERQLREVQRIARIGSWRWDIPMNHVTVSEELFHTFGIKPGEFVPTYEGLLARIHPEDRAAFHRIVQTSLVELKPHRYEYRIVRPDGTIRVIHAEAEVICDEQGKPIARLATTLDITERKQAEENLRESREQLRALAGRLQAAREEESLRISREIHDELGHALTSLSIDLVNLDQLLENDPPPRGKIRKRTKAMAKLVVETSRTVQRIAMDLRPSLLDDLGLAAALEWQVDKFAARTGLRCRWRHTPADCELPMEHATVVFRIFQEILTNIARHAQATKVDFDCTRQRGSLRLSIRDDGKGFDEKQLSARASLGLLGMRERALLISGSVEIQSAPGQGTTVTLTVPVGDAPDKTAGPKKTARRKKT